jgi:hypothetical protein
LGSCLLIPLSSEGIIKDSANPVALGSKPIVKALNRIVEVFSNPIVIEVVKTRSEEIRKIQVLNPSLL